MFDWKKPTVQMLGRWQPWHDGHTELFKRALKKTKNLIKRVIGNKKTEKNEI